MEGGRALLQEKFLLSNGSLADLVSSLLSQTTLLRMRRVLSLPSSIHTWLHVRGALLKLVRTAFGGSQGRVLWHGNKKVLNC